MWIMTNFGILMPAAIPTAVKIRLDNPEWDLQVRSRDRKELNKCLKRYAFPNSHSQIFATPEMDYDFRFYCYQRDFAQAVASMVNEIDYEKFKPTTLIRGNGGKNLHRLYNRIWGVVFDHHVARDPRTGVPLNY